MHAHPWIHVQATSLLHAPSCMQSTSRSRSSIPELSAGARVQSPYGVNIARYT